VHLGTPIEQNKTFILDPDSGAVFLEQSHLLVFFHDLRDEGLAAPRSIASPDAPRMVALPSKVASPATVVAPVATVVVTPLRGGLLGTSSCITLSTTTRFGPLRGFTFPRLHPSGGSPFFWQTWHGQCSVA
jgi:hypothetical protein